MTIEQTVRSFILENFLFTSDPKALADGDSFIDKGILDSTGVLEMVGFIEDEFGIKVADHEMVPEHLDSVNSIVAFVTAKTARTA